MDITYYTTGTSEEAQANKAKETASTGSANAADNITIHGVTFYGVNMPDYGKTQYMGFVNGYNIDISVYTDINNEVVQSFFENTQFIRQ